MHMENMTPWLRLTVAIVIFATPCVALGWLLGYIVRRNDWPGWLLALLVVASGFLSPVVVVLYSIHDAQRHLLEYPNDDAAGMVALGVIFFVAPLLFFASLIPILSGVALARRKKSCVKSTA